MFFILFVSTLVAFVSTEIFINSQYKVIILSQVIPMVLTSLLSAFLLSLNIKRLNTRNSISVAIRDDWNTFWTQFIIFMENENYSPLCVMENTFYFERRTLFINNRISLKKVTDKSIVVIFPEVMSTKIARHFSIYKKIEEMKLDLSQN